MTDVDNRFEGRTDGTAAAAILPAVPRRHRSLRAYVADLLRRTILSGEWQAGDRLLEEDIASRLQVSRGTVREAFRQLEQEGLIVTFPNRRTIVAETSEEELQGVLIPVRLVVERFAFHRALPRLTEADVTQLRQVVEDLRQAGESGDLESLVELDMSFHRVVVERSESLHTLRLWEGITPRVRGFFFRMAPRHATLAEIAQEHDDLLDSMLSADLDELDRVLDLHIRSDTLFQRA